jgi:dTDP-glucose 4,6-dehydratase
VKNLLVTGGAGFIGSNFVRYLLKAEPDVKIINLDALTYAGSLENLNDLNGNDRHSLVVGDISDRPLVDELLRKHRIDTVVHFAAETHVDRSILGPAQFIQTNIVGTFTLLEAVRTFWLDEKGVQEGYPRFHHVSTDEVYGSLSPEDPPFSEITPYAPNSPYAASKAASDHLVRAYFQTYQLPVTISNCSNNYGPYQFPEKLIPLMIMNAVRGIPLPVYGDGKQIRDWVYVEDHCEAVWMILKGGRMGETYNVGGDNQPTNLDVISSICAILDETLPNSPYSPHAQLVSFVTDRPGHDRRYAMDISKIKRELGWIPRQSLDSGLAETTRWYLSNANWIENVHKKPDYQQWIERNYAKRGG